MSPAEYGAWLATQTPSITDEAIDEGSRILAAVARELLERVSAA